MERERNWSQWWEVLGIGHPLTLFVWEFFFDFNYNKFSKLHDHRKHGTRHFRSWKKKFPDSLLAYLCTHQKKKWKLSCWYYLKLLTNLNSWKWCMYTYSFDNFAVHSIFSCFKTRNGWMWGKYICIISECFTFFYSEV